MQEPNDRNDIGIEQPPQTSVDAPPPITNRLENLFKGPNGLRAGWRFLIYFAIGAAIVFLVTMIVRHFRHPHPRSANLDRPLPTIVSEWMGFATFAFSAWIMSRIEKQPWGAYGLPVRQAFGKLFWLGGLLGCIGLSALMGCLWITHCYHIDGMALHGAEILKYAVLWLLAFTGVGMMEEFLFRGYAQYTLASGMRFWPAAILTSAIFAFVHSSNPGETLIGLIDVFIFGMLACFMWWRTGNLWLAVGFHSLWDWGQSYFFSVPDSGVPALGHLFNMRLQGPSWLSGGSAGPEGSVINLLFDLIWFAIIAWLFPTRKFVGMERPRLSAPADQRADLVIDSSALSS